jgi:hypothetical protein
MTLSSRGLFFEIVLEALLSTKRFEFALDHLRFLGKDLIAHVLGRAGPDFAGTIGCIP